MTIKKVLSTLLLIVVALFFLSIGLLTYTVQADPRQQLFLSGKVPAEYPDGVYVGSTTFPQTLWKGKKFVKEYRSGINIIQQGEEEVEAYPFTLSVGKGNVDKEIETIKIDYDLPQNAFYIRRVVDEIVLVSPNHYLGKVSVRLIGQIFMPVTYFELDQN